MHGFNEGSSSPVVPALRCVAGLQAAASGSLELQVSTLPYSKLLSVITPSIIIVL